MTIALSGHKLISPFWLENVWLPLIVGLVLLLVTFAGRVFRWLKERCLSAEEKDILAAAAHTGMIVVMTADPIGAWVRSGSKDFVSQEDRAVALLYLDALERLISRGMATHSVGIAYRLTHSGSAAAKKLKRRAPARLSS